MANRDDIEARLEALERKVSDLYRGLGRREPGGAGGASGGAGGASGGHGGGGPGSADEDPWIVELIAAGRKIEAIRAYQKSTGLGLKESKRAVERLEQLHRPAG